MNTKHTYCGMTVSLIEIAKNEIRRGKRVAFVSLEISPKVYIKC
jgi:hypothetical protein